jgi:exopolysaccharide production protein ExoZ
MEFGMIRSYPGTDYVTGLRAYAAMMVVFGHSQSSAYFGPLMKKLTNLPFGVQIFFVISGFSVAASFFKSGSFVEYIVRRFVRIWPVFFLAASTAFLCHLAGLRPLSDWMVRQGSSYDLYNYFMQITFLSFLDGRITNSLSIGEWTIPVEFVWYLILPAILMHAYDIRKLVACAIACAIAGALIRYGLKASFGQLGVTAYVRSPARWGVFFMFGVIAHWLKYSGPEVSNERASAFSLAGLATIILGSWVELKIAPEIVGLGVMIFIAYFRSQGGLLRVMFESRPVLFVGTISYSVYLTHLLVKSQIVDQLFGGTSSGMSAFWVVTLLTFTISTATYLLIERPTIRWGGRVAVALGERWGGRVQPVKEIRAQ